MNDAINKQMEVSDSVNRLMDKNKRLTDSYMQLAEFDAKYLDTLEILEHEREQLLTAMDDALVKAENDRKALVKRCAEFNK